MEFLREFKNYTLLDNITPEGLESLLNEYPEFIIGKETTTLKLRYATIPTADNWTILEWNSDKDLSDEMFFYFNQNILSWLNSDSNSKSATRAFALAFEENSPMLPTFFSHLDPENSDEDTTIGIYEEEKFIYYLPNGDLDDGEEVDLKFDLVEFLLDDFDFELDWLVDVDSFEWTNCPITIEYDEL